MWRLWDPSLYQVKFFDADGGGGGGKSQAQLDAEKELKEAKEAREKAEKELKDKKDAEDALRRTQEEKDLTDKKDWEGLKAKAQAERDALEKERKENAIQTALIQTGTKLGIKKDAYLTLVDRSKIEYKDGKVTGADTVMEQFKKDNPDLFGAVDGGAGGSDNKPTKQGESSMVDDLIKIAEKKRTAHVPFNWNKK